MTTTTTMEDQMTDTAEVSDAREAADIEAQQLFTDVLDQLADPRAILANALVRIHQADAVALAPDAGLEPEDVALYRLGTAFVLRGIAEVADKLNNRLTATNVNGNDDFYGPVAADPDYIGAVPEPTPGVRYAAELSGRRMGIIGGRDWLWLGGHGFVDITNADEHKVDGGECVYRLAGRVVSGTPTHVLLVTDGGAGHTLPRAWITESPDE